MMADGGRGGQPILNFSPSVSCQVCSVLSSLDAGELCVERLFTSNELHASPKFLVVLCWYCGGRPHPNPLPPAVGQAPPGRRGSYNTVKLALKFMVVYY